MEGIIKNGIICIFDILGYKSFLQNNSVFKCADNINNIILKLPEDVKNHFIGLFEKIEKFKIYIPKIDTFLSEKFNFVIVSDTILLVFDLSEIEDFDFSVFIALVYARLFQEVSFKNGFPMRGCLDVGSFYFNNNIFAGDTIVNSFKEAETINFSGLVITSNALRYLQNNGREHVNLFLQEYVNKYIVPLKNNIEEYKYLMEWAIDLKDMKEFDIKQYIFESFHAYNKEVSLSVMEKINNTEKIWRYFYMKRKGRHFA